MRTTGGNCTGGKPQPTSSMVRSFVLGRRKLTRILSCYGQVCCASQFTTLILQYDVVGTPVGLPCWQCRVATFHQDDWFLCHDTLALMTAKHTIKGMMNTTTHDERKYTDCWILPCEQLGCCNNDIPRCGKRPMGNFRMACLLTAASIMNGRPPPKSTALTW
jgi:hypothetical protein